MTFAFDIYTISTDRFVISLESILTQGIWRLLHQFAFDMYGAWELGHVEPGVDELELFWILVQGDHSDSDC